MNKKPEQRMKDEKPRKKASSSESTDEKTSPKAGAGADADTSEIEHEEAVSLASDQGNSEKASEEKEENDARYVRLAAEFQNYKKRTEKEKSDIFQYANEKIASDLLDVMDNFERAMLHSEEHSDKNFVEGMSLIFKQLKGVLDKYNVIEIPALGEDFDPNYHNAVMMEASEKYESGKVSDVMQKGYTLNGKVIRPSMVRVSQ